MGIDKTAECEIGRLVMAYTAHAKKAKKAHDDLAEYVWAYMDEHGIYGSVDDIEAMIDLIPKGTLLQLLLYDKLFEMKRQREVNTVEHP